MTAKDNLADLQVEKTQYPRANDCFGATAKLNGWIGANRRVVAEFCLMIIA